MRKQKITWEHGMIKLMALYTEAMISGNREEAISVGEEMIKIGRTLDKTQSFITRLQREDKQKTNSHLN
tara:strand:+ start:237 stop:443 length:207 start_codon:yes stop_codon:yes gene_type:complete